MTVSASSRQRISPTLFRLRSWIARRWRRVLLSLLILVLAFATATARLLVWPAQGMPARVDAIVMLAGPGSRLPVAVRLATEHRASVLVVSRGHLGYGGPCPGAIAGVTIICFDPTPSDTRGEAEFVSSLARERGWRSLTLVTTPEQDTRARLLMSRCHARTVYVVTAPHPWYEWPYQIAYGWGALLKALVVDSACLL